MPGQSWLTLDLPPGADLAELGGRPGGREAFFMAGAAGGSSTCPPALILVDPHQDLYRAALGLVPPARRGEVVALDLADATRPFGLNLLDTGLGWGRDEAVTNALTVFRRECDRFWGPHMADAFRFALLTLYEANAALCATDPVIHAWWSGYFAPLDRRAQLDIVNPVLTKVNTYAGTWAARAVVGQPRSTIDPAAWLRDSAIVAVNTAKGTVGAETAALVGGTLINLVGLAVAAQAKLPAGERRAVTLIVDELHTMPGADYESILSELAKYGANLILATQSLGRLDALDRPGERALKATLFANLDGLFAFHTSAEDARYLVPELGASASPPSWCSSTHPRRAIRPSRRRWPPLRPRGTAGGARGRGRHPRRAGADRADPAEEEDWAGGGRGLARHDG